MKISTRTLEPHSLLETCLPLDRNILFPSPDIGKAGFNVSSIKMKKGKTGITLEKLKENSDKVLQRIYKDNRDKFINFARQYNISDSDIIDTYHDAYIIFYNNIMNGKLQSLTSSISTYLISIGKYLILDKMKKNKHTISLSLDIPVSSEKGELTDEFGIDGLTEEQELLRTHFSKLGKSCRELLTLFYYRGFTIKDILDQGCYSSENVIKSTKSRCIKKLKERIKAYGLLSE